MLPRGGLRPPQPPESAAGRSPGRALASASVPRRCAASRRSRCVPRRGGACKCLRRFGLRQRRARPPPRFERAAQSAANARGGGVSCVPAGLFRAWVPTRCFLSFRASCVRYRLLPPPPPVPRPRWGPGERPACGLAAAGRESVSNCARLFDTLTGSGWYRHARRGAPHRVR